MNQWLCLVRAVCGLVSCSSIRHVVEGSILCIVSGLMVVSRMRSSILAGDWSALVVGSVAPGLRSSSPTAAPIGVGWADRLLWWRLLLWLGLVLLLLLLLLLVSLCWCRTTGVKLVLQHTSQLDILQIVAFECGLCDALAFLVDTVPWFEVV